MGRHRHIDHRQPPREAGVPKVLRDGKAVPYDPEPVNPNDPLVKAEKELETLRNRVEVAEQKAKVKEAEAKSLKDTVRNAQDENQYLRKQLQEQKDDGVKVETVEVVTIDKITRSGDTATLSAVCQIDGRVDEATVVLPVTLIKDLVKRKKKND